MEPLESAFKLINRTAKIAVIVGAALVVFGVYAVKRRG